MSEFKLGEHEAKIDTLIDDVAELKRQVGEVHLFVAQVRGGYKTLTAGLVTVGAFIGAVFAFLADLAKEWILGANA